MGSIIHITNIGITAGFISLLYAKRNCCLSFLHSVKNTYESKTAHSTQTKAHKNQYKTSQRSSSETWRNLYIFRMIFGTIVKHSLDINGFGIVQLYRN